VGAKIRFMKQFLMTFIICCGFSAAFAQYHILPEWAEDLPNKLGTNEIYAVGISDPRMSDKELAKEIALHRAIAMAVMLYESDIYYASDYFEKKSEEYRWFILKENVEELGKVKAYARVDEENYKILEVSENTNGETLVLIKYRPSNETDYNFTVNAEYYNQVFEVSNTRALEFVRSAKLTTSWKKEGETDSLKTYFHMTNFNNSISSEVKYGSIEIKSPGYSYLYKSSIPDSLVISNYTAAVNLQKGLWIAYYDSYLQSIMRISKNYSSKMGTVFDDYKVNRNDGITEYSTESLARSSCRNKIGFEYAGMGIHYNNLYPRIYIDGERKSYTTFRQTEIQDSIRIQEEKRNKCFFRRIFCKKKK
jgi:hypothetical protein